jgi:hypothetical protein
MTRNDLPGSSPVCTIQLPQLPNCASGRLGLLRWNLTLLTTCVLRSLSQLSNASVGRSAKKQPFRRTRSSAHRHMRRAPLVCLKRSDHFQRSSSKSARRAQCRTKILDDATQNVGHKDNVSLGAMLLLAYTSWNISSSSSHERILDVISSTDHTEGLSHGKRPPVITPGIFSQAEDGKIRHFHAHHAIITEPLPCVALRPTLKSRIVTEETHGRQSNGAFGRPRYRLLASGNRCSEKYGARQVAKG